ncbi:MAG: inositol monophosphatase [Lachnospiraceae bacterium]|nr:inositol monophosphatase [Lachnospiraceae bacterium]
MNPLYEQVIELVHSADEIIFDENLVHAVTVKGAADYVTKVDFAVQEFLRAGLAILTPEVKLISEEQENKDLDPAGSYWILDPIDGTTNLIHDYQMSAVSLGLYEKGQITFGVVYNPFMKETWHAVRGEGAYLNGQEIHVSHRADFETSVISFGAAPYDKGLAAQLFPIMRHVFEACSDFRRCASCALDLCYVATGRIDAYFELNLKPWDYAAGSLILTEAGGKIGTFRGKELPYLQNIDLIAATPEIYDRLRALIFEMPTDELKLS